MAVDEISEFKRGSSVRYVGLFVEWNANGVLFSIAEYCQGLQSSIPDKPLTFNRANVEKLTKTEGDVDKVMLQDLGK